MHHAKSASPPFVLAREERIETVGEGIHRQILGYGPDLMVCRVRFEKGAVGQVHAHPHSQSSYVESGRFLVNIDGEERELSAGDCFYAAPQRDHGSVCFEAGVLIDTFSPAREDFLPEGNPSC